MSSVEFSAELALIARALTSGRLRFRDEAGLQDAIEDAFAHAHVSYEREFRVDRASRIDFACGRVGVEVKVAGGPSQVGRQLARYAATGRFDELLLVTTRPQHQQLAQPDAAVPVHVLHLRGHAY